MEPNSVEASSRPERVAVTPAWEIPDAVQVASGINLAAEDPAYVEGASFRTCVALTRRKQRCSAPALNGTLLCTAHAGKLNQSAGGQARARQLRLVRETAQRQEILARMGARAVLAQRAIERASDLRRAFDVVLDDTMKGDKQQARTLLGYLTAAFPEGSEDRPSEGEAGTLTSLSTRELRALAFGSTEPNLEHPKSE